MPSGKKKSKPKTAEKAAAEPVAEEETNEGASEPIKNDDLVKDASELMTEDKQQEGGPPSSNGGALEKEASEKIADKEQEGAPLTEAPASEVVEEEKQQPEGPTVIEPAAELKMTPPVSPEKPTEAAVEPAVEPTAAQAPVVAPVVAPAAETPAASASGTDTTAAIDVGAAAQKRLLELLPNVKDAEVLQLLVDLPDAAALERLVQKGKPPPKANFAVRSSFGSFSGGNAFTANDNMKKAHDSQQAAKSQAKNLGTVDDKSLAVGGAGQGGGLGLNRPGFGPKVQHFAGGRGSVGGAKSINIDEAVSFAWSEMMDDKSAVSYVIATYTPDGKSLALQSKGEGGLNDFRSQLPEGIAWGGFRCNAIDKRGGLECKRPKFIFVQYKPETASAIKKAKQASHKGDVKEAFAGAHLDVSVETMEDLAEQSLITKLQAATGAHKPNGYEFAEGCFLEADFYGLGIGKSCKGESANNNQ